jgi:hypothetical protein
MKKTALFLFAFLFLFAGSVILAATAPTTVVIKSAAAKQPAVTFDHAKHEARAKTCDTCHHDSKGLTKQSKTEVKPCMACHLDVKGNVMPSAREMSMTKNPFHMKCLGCHKAEKKGPTTCTGCHKK